MFGVFLCITSGILLFGIVFVDVIGTFLNLYPKFKMMLDVILNAGDGFWCEIASDNVLLGWTILVMLS